VASLVAAGARLLHCISMEHTMSDGASDLPARPREDLDLGAVRELLRMMADSNTAEIMIRRGDFKIHVRRTALPATTADTTPPPMVLASSAGGYGSVHPVAAGAGDEPALAGHSINAPMVGTFYTAPSPKDPPFVAEGDIVQPGDPIGIIEAMKTMNEIASDIGGRVVRVLAKNGQGVEFGQSLVVIEPL
jgi:acetyl-CoA carboxylase biotin carboxyl carrier protein